MRLVRGADAARVRWRNDGGWTRELAREPAGDAGGFTWRVSVAEVETDGPFSTFDGYDRILVLLEGAGMDLCFRETERAARLRSAGDWLHFAGEAPIDAALIDGPTTDFNVIWCREAFSASVQGSAAGEWGGAPGEVVFGVNRSGDCMITAPGEPCSLDGAWLAVVVLTPRASITPATAPAISPND
ncbi:MAG: HutD family protein [Ilumatobacteraceae bacterium]